MKPQSIQTLKQMQARPEFENRVPWMYLDQYGNLTIGVGHKVADAGVTEKAVGKGIQTILAFGEPRNLLAADDMAERYISHCQTKKLKPLGDSKDGFFSLIKDNKLTLPEQPDAGVPGVWGFELPRPGGDQTTQQVMTQEAMKIMHLSGNQADAKSFFECFNSFELTSDAIDELHEADIAATINAIRNNQVWVHDKNPSKSYKTAAYPDFAGFDTFPEEVQMALVDLAFQLGVTGLYNHSKGAMRQAVKERDWTLAATLVPAVSHPDRTKWRKGLFETAAKTDPKAKKPTPPAATPKPVPQAPDGGTLPALPKAP